ncbi:Hypothetical protein NTJ_03926 [Nesidiocoris tenuis]|uniref:BED-type domain-containing protein n=1 Tax=Nesidiocoris tenuis TaxID=355587 RepID=A0ABN7AGM3_9HEMI|nr:Hypothetical protein NTJ_03926 [Nesidiocoris tenuis]
MNVSDLDSNGSVDSDYEEEGALGDAEKSEEATQIDNARAEEDHSSEISRTGVQHRMVIVDGKFYSYITERSNDRKVVAACKKCEPKVVEISGKPFVTSNFVKHLRRAHGAETVAEYKAYSQQKKLNRRMCRFPYVGGCVRVRVKARRTLERFISSGAFGHSAIFRSINLRKSK